MSDIAISPGAVAPEAGGQHVGLLKVLGPMHAWALDVGIVLVGQVMGWNYGVGRGGYFGALITGIAAPSAAENRAFTPPPRGSRRGAPCRARN